jgi:uncharacterized membrane protein YdbT with pleckstrin-like domain
LVDGLYTRAFAEANGDKDKAQAKYIVYRVEQLRGEFIAKVERKKAEAREAAKAAESAARRKQQAQDGKDSFFTIVAIILGIIGLALLIALSLQKSGASSM